MTGLQPASKPARVHRVSVAGLENGQLPCNRGQIQWKDAGSKWKPGQDQGQLNRPEEIGQIEKKAKLWRWI